MSWFDGAAHNYSHVATIPLLWSIEPPSRANIWPTTKGFFFVVSSFDQQQVIYVEPSRISIPENCTGTRGIINHPRIMVFKNLHAQRSHTLCRPLCLLTIAWCMSFAYHHIFCMQTMSQNDGFLVSWTLSKENAVSRFQNNNGLSFRSDSMYVC